MGKTFLNDKMVHQIAVRHDKELMQWTIYVDGYEDAQKIIR